MDAFMKERDSINLLWSISHDFEMQRVGLTILSLWVFILEMFCLCGYCLLSASCCYSGLALSSNGIVMLVLE